MRRSSTRRPEQPDSAAVDRREPGVVHLVSYPRSGNTLARGYFSILQGRPQRSVYAGDVVPPIGPPLTHALDHVDLVKSHRIPVDSSPMIYLVRDGRNATLSFLYMAFLFGGHQYSELSEVCEAIAWLDATEGSWTEHVLAALARGDARRTLFIRYEDLVSRPDAALKRMVRFLKADVPVGQLRECVRLGRGSDRYAQNPHNGYLYQPAAGSIYDILKQRRRGDYWRRILDRRTRRYFHDRGATPLLLNFRYEQSENWWRE